MTTVSIYGFSALRGGDDSEREGLDVTLGLVPTDFIMTEREGYALQEHLRSIKGVRTEMSNSSVASIEAIARAVQQPDEPRISLQIARTSVRLRSDALRYVAEHGWLVASQAVIELLIRDKRAKLLSPALEPWVRRHVNFLRQSGGLLLCCSQFRVRTMLTD